MGFERTKTIARRAGVYRHLRWVVRNILRPAERRAFRTEREFYRQLLPSGALCFDVGANYGWKTEVLLSLGARVIAFEPQTDCLAELSNRVGNNPRFTGVRAGVGRVAGEATLYVRADSVSSSLLAEWKGAFSHAVTVPMTTLDAAIAKYGVPHYVKIDVEGFEPEVFAGLNQSIPLISYEYHVRNNGVQTALACLKRLQTLHASVLLNVTPAEHAVFAQSWMAPSIFGDFLTQISSRPEYVYGDIFVKLS